MTQDSHHIYHLSLELDNDTRLAGLRVKNLKCLCSMTRCLVVQCVIYAGRCFSTGSGVRNAITSAVPAS